MLGRVARRRPKRIYARSAQSIVARARSPTSATISAMRGPANHGRDLTSETVGRADEHFDGDRSVYQGNLRRRRTGCYIARVIAGPGPLMAEIAGLVGEPARATMLSALLDGRALTATELAYAARVTRQTASTHLAKLAEAGLVAPIRDGRYRYFRLASPRVAEMLDGIMAVALEHRPRYRPLSRQGRELSVARICNDHLAGRLSVDLTDAFVAREYVVLDDEAAEITTAGSRCLTDFGITLRRATRRPSCRLCLDWTERRRHIAGAIGAALTMRYFDLGWLERMMDSHAVIVTPEGRRGLQETFGIDTSEAGDGQETRVVPPRDASITVEVVNRRGRPFRG